MRLLKLLAVPLTAALVRGRIWSDQFVATEPSQFFSAVNSRCFSDC